ncbi:MAG: hypothetical protein H6993_14980 [Pseudomonadales bacterium]|nr:hypothetical protein [Pseudomonadales bacterium]MCP5185267.1 hypothetical protein [Pseudomonadales bacterium]
MTHFDQLALAMALLRLSIDDYRHSMDELAVSFSELATRVDDLDAWGREHVEVAGLTELHTGCAAIRARLGNMIHLLQYSDITHQRLTAVDRLLGDATEGENGAGTDGLQHLLNVQSVDRNRTTRSPGNDASEHVELF